MSSPSVSVAIASYNGGRFIAEQIISICRQSIFPAEIVLADDGSRDDTVSIAVEIAESFSIPIKVIRHAENVGIVKNFMSAFRRCTGDFIAYCDQDDVWSEEKLSTFLRANEACKLSLFIHASEVVNEELVGNGTIIPLFGKSGALCFPSYLHGYYGFGHQMIFDRRLMPLLEYLHSADHGRLSTCLDWMIPFAASAIGSVWLDVAPLVKFRRHSLATSSAGKESVGSIGVGGKLRRKRAELVDLRQEIRAILADRELRAVMSAVDPLSTDRFYMYLRKFDSLLDFRLALYGIHGSRFLGLYRMLSSGGYADRRTSGLFGKEALLHDLFGFAAGGFCRE